MTKLFKSKILVIIMIVLALATVSAAFSVSYAKWANDMAAVSANGSTGLWESGSSSVWADNIYENEVYINGSHIEIGNWANEYGQQYVKIDFTANAGETVVLAPYKDNAPVLLELGIDTDPSIVTRKSDTEFLIAESGAYAAVFNLDQGTMDIVFSKK